MHIFADEQEEKEEKEDEKGFTPLHQRLLETRTILLFGEINMEMAQRVTGQLLVLDADSNEPIKLIITTPGSDSVMTMRNSVGARQTLSSLCTRCG